MARHVLLELELDQAGVARGTRRDRTVRAPRSRSHCSCRPHLLRAGPPRRSTSANMSAAARPGTFDGSARRRSCLSASRVSVALRVCCTSRCLMNIMAPLTSGPDRRLPGMYRTIVGSSSTFSLRASQRYQPRAVHRSSWPPGFESRVPIHVRPPLLTSTLCPDHGTSERSCTHPACAACSPSTSASHPHRLSPDGPASAP